MRYQGKKANLVSVSVVDNLGLLNMLGDVLSNICLSLVFVSIHII